MNFLKNLWSKVTGLYSYLTLWRKVSALTGSFPGTEDENKLRLWIIAEADNFAPVAAATATPVDDTIVHWVKTIALKEKAFKAIYSLLTLGCELIPKGEPVYGQSDGFSVPEKVGEAVHESLDDETVGNPLIVIAAIGLLLQVIMFLRDRKKQ
jgi:hypothetical protein